MKLHIYEHCPFCVRARMIFGIKKIPLELRVMSEADGETSTRMVSKKLPLSLRRTTVPSWLRVGISFTTLMGSMAGGS